MRGLLFMYVYAMNVYLWPIYGSAGKVSPGIFQNLWFVFIFWLFFIPSVRLIWLCSAFTCRKNYFCCRQEDYLQFMYISGSLILDSPLENTFTITWLLDVFGSVFCIWFKHEYVNLLKFTFSTVFRVSSFIHSKKYPLKLYIFKLN